MITGSPSQVVEATTEPGIFSTGLAGTIGVRIVDNQGATSMARSTANIIELVSGSGIYARTSLTLPGTPGQYTLIWDNASGTYETDDIIVSTTPSGVALVLPAGGVSPVVSQTFFIKRGDNEPLIFAVTELDSSGVPQIKDVSGWTGKFKLRAAPDTGTVIINQNFYISTTTGAVTTDGSLGLLAYAWPNTGETDREGLFFAEFECHRADGTKKTYPTTSDLNNEYIKVYFVPDLDDAGSH